MSDLVDRAARLHQPGPEHKNCCQSVLGAAAPIVGLDEQTALNLATAFGSGMQCGELCGALTGSIMAIGLRFGDTPEAKQLCRAFTARFRETFGSLVCREIRDHQTGRKDCQSLVKQAAALLEQFLSEAE